MTRVTQPPGLRVGLLGCGSISGTYLRNAPRFRGMEIVACADRDPDAAQSAAAFHGLAARTWHELLADPDIDAVLILTPAISHAALVLEALAARKHVYVEKPLATDLGNGRKILAAAAQAGRRVGCAPDTFLGDAHQSARRLVDAGAIGRPVAAAAAMLDRGMEAWHPDPAPFFAAGGGPLFDMGPYYLTSLVALLGPVRAVTAMAATGLQDRRVRVGRHAGQPIRPDVATTIEAVLAFAGGPIASLTMSWDVWRHTRPHLEIYGTEGSLGLPDPNWFGGDLRWAEDGADWCHIPSDPTLGAAGRRLTNESEVADHRIVGLVDMAHAITDQRPHRASAELACHVLEVMTAALRSSVEQRTIAIESDCPRPQPLAEAEAKAWLR